MNGDKARSTGRCHCLSELPWDDVIFLDNRTCLHLHVNFSRTAHQISRAAKFEMAIPGLKWYSISMPFITDDIAKSKIFRTYRSVCKQLILGYKLSPYLEKREEAYID